MRIIAFLILMLAIPTLSQAGVNPDKLGMCYLIDDSRGAIMDKDACIISTGTGVGGSYTDIRFNRDNYEFEMFEWTDGSYLRDATMFSVITSEERMHLPDENNILLCFPHKPFDICYRTIH